MKQRLIVLLTAVLLIITGVVVSAQDEQADENTPPFDTLITAVRDGGLQYLVTSDGMTLYRFALDDALCVDDCLEVWQPFTVDSEDALTTPEDVPGTLGTFDRGDGVLQVTYNDMPLYTFVNDAEFQDRNGDRVNDVWFVVEPQNLYIASNEEIGRYLVSGTGMTLYVSLEDFPNASNCIDDCLQTWLPYIVASDAELTKSRAVFGNVSLIERPDTGEFQMTYNERPLYLYSGDTAIGDTNGQGIDENWLVFPPETITSIGIESTGTFLVGPQSRPLYAFQGDLVGESTCVDECTDTWIPFTIGLADRLYGTPAVQGEIDRIVRPDGSFQVTFNRMPLYYYSGDSTPFEINGNGIDDDWFAVPSSISRDNFMILTTESGFGGDDEDGEG